jgi:hypothetical protein
MRPLALPKGQKKEEFGYPFLPQPPSHSRAFWGNKSIHTHFQIQAEMKLFANEIQQSARVEGKANLFGKHSIRTIEG